MDQCFSAKEYPKIFLISSELITTKPPVFSSDMLNHPRLQFLHFTKATSGKQEQWEEWEESVSPWEQAAAPTALSSPGRTSHSQSLPSLPSSPAPFLRPHCLCPPLLLLTSIHCFPHPGLICCKPGYPNSSRQPEPFFKSFSSLPIKWGTSCPQWDKGIAHR